MNYRGLKEWEKKGEEREERRRKKRMEKERKERRRKKESIDIYIDSSLFLFVLCFSVLNNHWF